MNIKKMALLVFLSIAAFPSLTNAKPQQGNTVVYPMKQSPASRLIGRVLSLGRKSR
jgi:hypothetical protein